MKRLSYLAAILVVMIFTSALYSCDIEEVGVNPIDSYGDSETSQEKETDNDSQDTEKAYANTDSNSAEETEAQSSQDAANDKDWTIAA